MGFEIINTLKRAKGITNAQLADMSGVTLSTIDKITSGVNTNPKLDTLLAICKVLGCSLNDFVEKEKSPDMTVAMPGDSEEDVIVFLGQMLTKRGYMNPGEPLSDSDYQFLTHLVGLLDTHFEQRRKG